jgi:hypothetical protein
MGGSQATNLERAAFDRMAWHGMAWYIFVETSKGVFFFFRCWERSAFADATLFPFVFENPNLAPPVPIDAPPFPLSPPGAGITCSFVSVAALRLDAWPENDVAKRDAVFFDLQW